MISGVRARLRSERGLTLAELLVTMSLLTVVSVIFMSIMVSVQAGVEKQLDRSNDNDQARLAVQQLDREIRSGNVLYNPGAETSPFVPFYSLRVYTQSNANIRNPGNQCVQWRIVNERLERRSWATGNPGGVTPWRVVAENIVNATLPTPVPAFVLDGDPSKGGRVVNITIVTQTNENSGDPVRISVSVTGRNTSYGYPIDVCAVVPPV